MGKYIDMTRLLMKIEKNNIVIETMIRINFIDVSLLLPTNSIDPWY